MLEQQSGPKEPTSDGGTEGDLDAILTEGQIVLLMVPPAAIPSSVLEILSHLTKRGIKGIFVSVTRTFDALQRVFDGKGIDRNSIFVIDTLSGRSGARGDEPARCLYVSSPAALSDISILLDTALDQLGQGAFLLFDSVATLLMFNQFESVVKFFGFLTTKLRKRRLLGVLFTLSTEERRLSDHISVFCDRVLERGMV